MAIRTINVFAVDGVTVTHADGGPVNNPDILNQAQWGNAFNWENPHDLTFTFPTQTTAITFSDSDGALTEDPYHGNQVIDQQLEESVTINGVTYDPSEETTRWADNPPVTIENEYEVTLFDAAGTEYRLVAVSITQGYDTQVVGVMFDGPTPPPGTELSYIRRESEFKGNNQSMTIPEEPICFLRGTLIDTPQGPRPIETLKPGDEVLTLDAGVQPVIWTGRTIVEGQGDLAPIRISAGALGNGRDLLVSPNHRILVTSAGAELLYGHTQVLVPAKALTFGAQIHRAPMPQADYFHLLLAGHEMVFSEGIATESLFLGDVTLGVLGPRAKAQLERSLPDFEQAPRQVNRPALSLSEARVLMQSDEADGPKVA